MHTTVEIEEKIRQRYRQPKGVEQFGIEPVPPELKTVRWLDIFSIIFGFALNPGSMLVGGLAVLSGLSFLGLGARPPAAEWGSMVSSGAQHFEAWWMGVFPGLAIVSVVLAFNFLGDSLRDAFDPRANK